ncbi:unnamed protein product [Dicrocoelium dendriticum]|nr:unnamed protein product [Dicrocoelium dendriticum]
MLEDGRETTEGSGWYRAVWTGCRAVSEGYVEADGRYSRSDLVGRGWTPPGSPRGAAVAAVWVGRDPARRGTLVSLAVFLRTGGRGVRGGGGDVSYPWKSRGGTPLERLRGIPLGGTMWQVAPPPVPVSPITAWW